VDYVGLPALRPSGAAPLSRREMSVSCKSLWSPDAQTNRPSVGWGNQVKMHPHTEPRIFAERARSVNSKSGAIMRLDAASGTHTGSVLAATCNQVERISAPGRPAASPRPPGRCAGAPP
jgi:hypothetical protein